MVIYDQATLPMSGYSCDPLWDIIKLCERTKGTEKEHIDRGRGCEMRIEAKGRELPTNTTTSIVDSAWPDAIDTLQLCNPEWT